MYPHVPMAEKSQTKCMVSIMNSKVDSINLLCQMILFSSNCQKQSRSHIRKKSRPLQNAQLSK